MNVQSGRTARRGTALFLLAIAWEAASRLGWLNPLYASSPTTVGSVLVSLFSTGNIWPHLAATLTAALGGLAGGLVLGVLLGFAGALIPLLAELLEPLMILLNAIPRVI